MTETGKEPPLIARIEYYREKYLEKVAEKSPTFQEFIGNVEVIKFGDELLSHGLSTGYNFGTEADFPITVDKPVILHSNYIQRSSHFGELIARMEIEEIIGEDDITFGFKASKVLGNWGDPEAVVKTITRNGVAVKTSETVEAIVIFHPKNLDNAIDIATFLQIKAKMGGFPYEISGSWSVPDARAPETQHPSFVQTLLQLKFKQCVANLYNKFPEGNIVALRQKGSILDEGWKRHQILINAVLFDWLIDDIVKP